MIANVLPPITSMAPSALAGLQRRFWAKVNIQGRPPRNMQSRCWLWTGATKDFGYGFFYVGGGRKDSTLVSAHRVSWWLHNGEDAEPLYVLHRCDVPQCVRPEHLFLGTLSDNSRDCVEKGRHDCAPGERRSNSILTEAAVKEIRDARRRGGGSLRRGERVALAEKFGVRPGTITQAASGEKWAHVD